MAVKLRLKRMGRKKRPVYRIVAADSRSPRNGRFIEELGYYNPLSDPMTIVVKEDRAMYWLQQGAIPSDTVKSLLKSKGIILRLHLMKRGLDETKIEEELKRWEILQVEKIKRQAEKKALEKEKAKAKKKEQEQKESAEVAPAPVEAGKAEDEPASEPETGKAEEAKEETPAETPEPAAAAEETSEEKEEKPKQEEAASEATDKREDAGEEEKKEVTEATRDAEKEADESEEKKEE